MVTGRGYAGGHRRLGRHIAAWATTLALVAGLGVVPATAARAPAPAVPAPALTAPTRVPGGPAGPGSDREMDRGEELYLQSCASCHGPRGQGTQRGPSLVGVGAASVDFHLSTGRMPPARQARQQLHTEPAFSAADIRAIVAQVAGFGADGPQIPRVGPGDVTTGRALFLANCAACHSATGAGGALTNAWIAPPLDRATPTQVAEAVRVGPGLMPAFPPSVFTDTQVDALARYVQELQGGRLDRGGAPLGRLGPSTEGLLAWVIGLVLLLLGARWLGRRAGE